MRWIHLSKKSIFLFVGLLCVSAIGIGFYFFSSETFRDIANFSNDEIEYAENFLLEESSDYSELDVHPQWKDGLEKTPKIVDTIQQRLENELKVEYEEELLETLKERTGKERKKTNLEENLESQGQQFFEAASEETKKELAKTLVEKAREDGYEITLDEYYEVLSIKKIPQSQ